MSNLTNNTADLRDILVAINALPKAGSNSGIIPNGTKEIEKNGEYDVTNYAKANVNVPSKEPVLQEGSATPTKSQQTFNPPSGVDGFSEFVVKPIPDEYIVPEGTGEITNNGKFYVARYEMVNVNVPDVPAVTEELSVIKNGTWEPSAGVDGFSKVTVNVPDIPAVVYPLEVAENGTYIAPVGVDGYSPIVVDVKPVTDELTITENCTRIAADEGLDGYSKVIVNVPETTPVIQPLEVNENNVVLTPPDGVDGYSPITVNVPVENLDEEINEQSELIEVRAEYLNELLTVLDKKAAGSSVEMCTVTLTSSFDGVENLTEGHADAYVIEKDFSVTTEQNSACKNVGSFVNTSISISIPKGNLLILDISYDYGTYDSTGMFHPDEYVDYIPPKNFSLTGDVGFIINGGLANFGGTYAGSGIAECCGFVVYGDCSITVTPTS